MWTGLHSEVLRKELSPADREAVWLAWKPTQRFGPALL